MAKKVIRLDILLLERGLVESREKGRRLIMAGQVLVDGQMLDRPGALVAGQSAVALKARPLFVSRGGDKLAGALNAFQLNPQGWACADVGASTGGFTDCLLQHGAVRVYAIDVGSGILDWKLRSDPRVIVMENTNARLLERLPEPIRLAVIDASFISLRLLLPAVQRWLRFDGEIVALIKPQFEAGRERVGRNGVVRDPGVHANVLTEVLDFAAQLNLAAHGLIRSPLLGRAGNAEFLARLGPGEAGESRDQLVRGVGLA